MQRGLYSGSTQALSHAPTLNPEFQNGCFFSLMLVNLAPFSIIAISQVLLCIKMWLLLIRTVPGPVVVDTYCTQPDFCGHILYQA